MQRDAGLGHHYDEDDACQSIRRSQRARCVFCNYNPCSKEKTLLILGTTPTHTQ